MAAIEGASRHGGSVGDTTHDLYRRYGKQIYAYCYHRLRSKEEAEDAVQTTFMNAFRNLQRGGSAEHEQAWLYKIAQNVCIARHSSSSRRLRLESPNDFETLQEVVPSREGDEPLELFGIEEALERMPENQRRAILLREWQGLSYREISEQLDLSQAAVEMLIFRARRTLAGALEQPGEEKKRRVGRKVGSLGSILGALKTLLGGGAAIKAAAVAAAAIAVVGEGASHTIVRHQTHASSARRVRASQPVSAAVAQSPSHSVAAGRNAGVEVAAKHIHATPAVAPKAAPVTPRTSLPPAVPEPAAAPSVTTTVTTSSAPATPPASAAPQPAAPAPAPAPATPAASGSSDKPKDKEPAPATTFTPVPAAAPSPMEPVSVDTSGGGKDKLKEKPPVITSAPAPVQAPTTTTPVTTAPAPVSADPQTPQWKQGLPEQTTPILPTAAPAPVVTSTLGKDKQQP